MLDGMMEDQRYSRLDGKNVLLGILKLREVVNIGNTQGYLEWMEDKNTEGQVASMHDR